MRATLRCEESDRGESSAERAAGSYRAGTSSTCGKAVGVPQPEQ